MCYVGNQGNGGAWVAEGELGVLTVRGVFRSRNSKAKATSDLTVRKLVQRGLAILRMPWLYITPLGADAIGPQQYIPIEKEPDGMGPPYERCCFCDRPTPYWTATKRRKAGEQVACCPDCAATKQTFLLPSKQQWFDRQNAAQ